MNTPIKSTGSFFTNSWHKFWALSRTVKIICAVVLVVVVGGILVLARGKSNDAADTTVPTVMLQSVGSFGGGSDSVEVLGTVQSVSEADILAQSGGTVEAVHTTLGASVPAGFVIASLDSSAASAAVLQAQGGYDAAVAASKATSLQAQNSTGSLSVEQTAVRTTYGSTYSSLDSTLSTNVDAFFGGATAVGPALLISPLYTGDTLLRERAAITVLMNNWRDSLTTDATADPSTLLNNAESTLNTVSNFLTDLGALADQSEAGATPAQLASLSAARTSVNGLLANISATRTAYNASLTAAAVGQTQSSSANTGVTSSEATIEEALGGLRSAQAAYEKTVIRAPIAGTINFLPIHVGDYVTPNEHVATVARNNALEVVINLSQANRDRIAVGDTLTIEGSYKGVVTTISPALDPVTKQIEVDVAVNTGADLVNGQSVQVALPAPTAATTASAAATSGKSITSPSAATGSASSTSSIELPLAAVKLLPNERDVFTVDATGHLVAHPVDIGTVIGDSIQITTPLAADLMIVTDARGLSAGDAVQVSTSTASQ